jgi:hypothetical protein
MDRRFTLRRRGFDPPLGSYGGVIGLAAATSGLPSGTGCGFPAPVLPDGDQRGSVVRFNLPFVAMPMHRLNQSAATGPTFLFPTP